MKFAAIADVHGNHSALIAVLADIQFLGITEMVNLGDHLSGPLEAGRTADLLMERDIPSIQGDQDRILVELDRAGTSNRLDYKQLTQAHLDWLATQPLCHGAPRDDTAYWLDQVTKDALVCASPIENVEQEAFGIAASLILCPYTYSAHRTPPRWPPRRQSRQCWLPGIHVCQTYFSQSPDGHAKCLLRHTGESKRRMERNLSIRSVRSYVDG